MSLRIEDAPNFTADTIEGPIDFHGWMGNGYAVLFSHPKDFPPVCMTELEVMAGMIDTFANRNARIVGISVDPTEDHHRWKSDIESYSGEAVTYPMIGDPQMKVAKLYGMTPAEEEVGTARAPAQNATVRSVCIIGPDKKVKLVPTYPMTTGQNFDEILRALDPMRLTAEHQVETPANWNHGEDVIVTSAVSDEYAEAGFGGFERKLPYLRTTRQPG